MALGFPRWTILQLLKVLPRNLMSRIAGIFAAIRWPGFLQRIQIRSFARTFGVDLDEVRDPLASFDSVQSFFVRALTEGARPVDEAADAFVSPCDGAWGMCGTIDDGTLLQVKGVPYAVGDLLGERADPYEGGTYGTLYLSPKDYHRFHAPCAGRVRRARYIPGSLWPVNRIGLEGVPGLFAKNERIVAFVDVEGAPEGTPPLALIPVGATMVGKVLLTFDDLTTNAGGRAVVERTYDDKPVTLTKGEEWGRFCFGSTIIVVAPPDLLTLDVGAPGAPLVLGTRIGTLRLQDADATGPVSGPEASAEAPSS